MHQAQFFGLCGAEGFTFHQIGLCTHQAQMARHLGHAAGTRQQAQGHFRQAELNLAVVNGDAVVADQRHFPAAAQGGATQQADDGFAQGLHRAEVVFDLFNLGKHRGGIGRADAHGGFEVGPGKKGGLGRGEQDAANRLFVLEHLRRQGVHIVFPIGAHGVDGRARLVKRDRGNAVLELVLDGFHIQTLSTIVAMPMPPPTHSVASP